MKIHKDVRDAHLFRKMSISLIIFHAIDKFQSLFKVQFYATADINVQKRD